ncbi:MAG TPA: sigma factor-like helix-turn-helix DNA-binding protein [Acidimicrobiales bacterium]|nr:sigma factor-like helix-turn-helix DNA-binding protein [Acidimicrobiales bacterium]
MIQDDTEIRSWLDAAGPEALGHLSDRERDILGLRFGLDDGKFHTREEVGQLWGVTTERIRQIEIKVLAKLRRGDNDQMLRESPKGT